MRLSRKPKNVASSGVFSWSDPRIFIKFLIKNVFVVVIKLLNH